VESFDNTVNANAGKGLCDSTCSLARRSQHLCLPHTHYRPALGRKRTIVLTIARHVASHLLNPVRRVVPPPVTS